MEKLSPGNDANAMDHYGQGCWTVEGGGVMNGFAIFAAAVMDIMELLMQTRLLLLQALLSRHILKVG